MRPPLAAAQFGVLAMQSVKIFLAFLFFAAGAVFVAWHDGPGLWRDFQIRSAGVVPVEGARSVSAWCKPSQFVFSSCDVSFELAEGTQGEKAKRYEVDFTTLIGLFGRQQVTVVRSMLNPAQVSTGLNLDYLWSRFLVFLFLEGTCISILVVGAIKHLKDVRVSRQQAIRPSGVPPSRRPVVQPAARLFGTR